MTASKICATCGTRFERRRYKCSAPRWAKARFCSRDCQIATTGVGRRKYASAADAVQSNISPEPNTGCWLWAGPFMKETGYGRVGFDNREILAHRLSFEVHVGPVSADLMVCHTCDVPLCVNPQHLFLGTCKDNMMDAASKQRTTLGERNAMARLSADEVVQIRAARSAGRSLRDIGDEFNVSEANVRAIAKRETWRHIA